MQLQLINSTDLQVVGTIAVCPIYTRIFSDIYPLLSAPNFPIMINPAQIV
jgi:hypothetical protein